MSNQYTDTYRGSIENRSQFGLEIIKAIMDAIGADRVSVQLSPWSTFQDMCMDNPVPQFTHFTSTLKYMHPDLVYLHIVEPKTARNEGIMHTDARLRNDSSSELNDFLYAIWSPKPLISVGGFIRECIDQSTGEGRYYCFWEEVHFKCQAPLVSFWKVLSLGVLCSC
ncbi:hypothetical protein BDQ17DRAFT_1528743 [Cyathus striatus]|nr:hypothetical protein BDQ17DRAFT_1528743 [Cyathus striatus]